MCRACVIGSAKWNCVGHWHREHSQSINKSINIYVCSKVRDRATAVREVWNFHPTGNAIQSGFPTIHTLIKSTHNRYTKCCVCNQIETLSIFKPSSQVHRPRLSCGIWVNNAGSRGLTPKKKPNQASAKPRTPEAYWRNDDFLFARRGSRVYSSVGKYYESSIGLIDCWSCRCRCRCRCCCTQSSMKSNFQVGQAVGQSFWPDCGHSPLWHWQLTVSGNAMRCRNGNNCLSIHLSI